MATFGNDALTEEHINFADRPRPLGRGSGSTGGGTGPQGPVGPTGPQGPRGDDGDDGQDGQDGAQGTQGIQGPAGNDGAAGNQGVKGDKGDKGDPGPASPAGLNWYGQFNPVDDYIPNDTVGYNGASYFCINSCFGSEGAPDVNTADWALLAAMGAPGSDGADGSDGSDGATGPKGDQGLQGPPGAQGEPGVDGVDGTDGMDGAQGPAGEGAGQMEVVTTLTRGVGVSVGEIKFETDTERLIIWNGSIWLSLIAKDIPIPPTDLVSTITYPDFMIAPTGVEVSISY